MAQPCPAIITIGASAGGVEALSQLVEQLPPGLPAAVLVAIHFPANSTSLLPKILNQLGTLPARHPQDGECIKPGQIYAALPDH
ncbi:MAG TPA: chemotaxis protein CheB, partial [Trichocoleus sp.]